jgi:hypothetical protein
MKKNSRSKPRKGTNPIHINKTGRFCFNLKAQEHMGDTSLMKAEVDGRVIRLKPIRINGALRVSRPCRTVYISEGQCLPILEPLGFDGSKPYDPDVKFCDDGGFEFEFRP